jgi:curved DNA-binding protein
MLRACGRANIVACANCGGELGGRCTLIQYTVSNPGLTSPVSGEVYWGNVAMTDGQPFIDYYNILQVNSNCDAKILEAAYHYLAKMHHPDRTGSADATKFNEVIEAYRVLRNPDRRAEYDRLYAANNNQDTLKFPSINEMDVNENIALTDGEVHAKILLYLYKRRREHAKNAGIAGFYVQEMLNCSDEHFEFHAWYLKEKGFIVITEQGTLAITVQGVDHVISMSRTTRAEKLLIAQSGNPQA